MADGRVIFDIEGNNKPFKESLTETTKAIQTETKKWEGSVDDSSGAISSGLTGAFKAVVASAAFVQVGQMLMQLGKESLGLASDLEEVQNVVDNTFGAEGSQKLERWAKNATSQFGLTELQAKRYASTLGAMMSSSGVSGSKLFEMSTTLAGLVADMSSFYNMDFDVAFQKVMSGMAGEIEPLRAIGVDMSIASMEAYAMANGMETAYEKMTASQKAMLRYEYLLEKTTLAQGDFAETADSYANSQRRMQTGFDTLKAQLGEAILPIATTVSNAINDLLDVLTYEPPENVFDQAGQSIADAEMDARRAQGILGYMDKLQEKYGDAAANTKEWALALGELKEIMPGVSQYISDEAGALTANNEQLREYIENTRQAAIEKAKQNAVQTLNDEYTKAGMDYYTAEINQELANVQAKEAAMALIDYIVEDYKSRGLGNDEYTKDYVDRNKWYEGLTNGSFDMNYLMYEAYGAANNRGDDYTMIEEYKRIYDEQSKASSDAAKEMGALQAKMQALETDLSIANSALARLASAASNAAGNLSGVGGSPLIPINAIPGVSVIHGRHAQGLNYVPFDGYTAYLHKGERIQTAAEASLSRMYGLRQPGVDYGTVGAAMWDNAPKSGGNVFLDGRVVGQVISDMQARSFKSLKRSGWQA